VLIKNAASRVCNGSGFNRADIRSKEIRNLAININCVIDTQIRMRVCLVKLVQYKNIRGFSNSVYTVTLLSEEGLKAWQRLRTRTACCLVSCQTQMRTPILSPRQCFQINLSMDVCLCSSSLLEGRLKQVELLPLLPEELPNLQRYKDQENRSLELAKRLALLTLFCSKSSITEKSQWP